MSVTHHGVTYTVADGHAHIYPGKIAEKATAAVGDFYGIPMENLGLPHLLQEEGSKCGIAHYLVSSVATKADQARSITSFIAQKCTTYPAYVGLGAWHQGLTDIDGEFDFIQSQGLKGIKLHPDFQRFPIDAPNMLQVYREAARRKMVVLFHTGDDRMDYSDPARLAAVLERVPDLTAIAAHLGGYRRHQEARHCLAGSGVYIDTSSSLFYLSPEDAVKSIHLFGADHTLFGTDFPMWSPEIELKRFFALGLSQAENRQILFETFAKLFL